MKKSGVREMLYQSLRLLNNERKFDIFKILVEKNEVTSVDIREELCQKKENGENISYIDDTLRELERVKIARRIAAQPPTTSRGQTASKRQYKEKFVSYSLTKYGNLVNKFLKAYESDTPWSDLQPSPEDLLKIAEDISADEFKNSIEKFTAIYFFTSLLFGIGSKNETTSNHVLFVDLRGKMSPQQINALLKKYPIYVKTHSEIPSKIDKAKTAVARALKGKILRYWLNPCKVSYSLTVDGERIVNRLLKQGIFPEDLALDFEYVEQIYTRRELVKRTFLTIVKGLVTAGLGVVSFWAGINVVITQILAGTFLLGFGAVMFWGLFTSVRDFYDYSIYYRQEKRRPARHKQKLE